MTAAKIAKLLARGDAFVFMGDIAAARAFYQRAADAGDGQAALRVGATFDPAFLSRAGLRGTLGDPVQARSWYRRGLDLGAPKSESRRNDLETR
jgi:TPR repeat protein